MKNLSLLNAKAYTPEVCLSQVADKLDTIKSLVVLVEHKDGTADTYMSCMNLRNVSYLAKVLDRRIYMFIEDAAK